MDARGVLRNNIMKTLNTIKDKIFWAYANLAMAHSAVSKKQKNYSRIIYIIRSRLFKGLSNGTMQIRTLFDDEKNKYVAGNICSYCGSFDNLTLDHIVPKKLLGRDISDNLILVCKSCNSSKGTKDLFEWMSSKNKFLPLLVIRRHLKLLYYFCDENDLLDKSLNEVNNFSIPFKFNYIPIDYPQPDNLILTYKSSN